MKRTAIALLMAVLMLCSLCCAEKPAETANTPLPTAGSDSAPTEPAAEDPTASPTEAAATSAPEGIPVRMVNGGRLSFLPEEPLSVPTLSEMVYTRPDTSEMIAKMEALTEKVPACGDAEELLNDYYETVPLMQSFLSMSELSFVRYCADTSDEFFADEYEYCYEQYGIVSEKENALYAAFAASPCRDALEEAYFGEGFFEDYDEFNEANEAYYELKQQENDLLFEYYDLVGEANLYSAAGIDENYEAIGNVFIELVKVRQQIAKAKGYDSCMDYLYACEYKRDYSTAEARVYLDQMKTLIAPLMLNNKITGEYAYYSNWSESRAMEYLSSAAERMGGPIWESCRFLSGHELYDIAYSGNKLSIGFTDYIADYEAPVIFIDPDSKDLLTTLFHEFGHFVDYYSNYGNSGGIETSETYSQAMQYLAFKYADPFSESARENNLRAALSDLLVYSILREGAYGDFELQVCSLAPEELTLDRIDAVYAQCMEDYGLGGLDDMCSYSKYWIAYGHFFERPGYVIAYSVSAVSALQICRLEAEEPGAGIEAFCRLLERTHGKKFAAVLEEAGLDSPFETETMEKTAEFLKQAFDME